MALFNIYNKEGAKSLNLELFVCHPPLPQICSAISPKCPLLASTQAKLFRPLCVILLTKRKARPWINASTRVLAIQIEIGLSK